MKKENNTKNKSILAVVAHPDDETFGMGGTLAMYAHNGTDVNLICCTRGEAGDIVPGYMNGFKSVEELRMSELACAAKTLGIKQTMYLDYRDSGMPGSHHNEHPDTMTNTPVEKVASDIAFHIRNLKPDVVITHDQIGTYRHPDHIAANRATVLAVQMAADENTEINSLPAHQVERLYFHTMNRKTMRFLLKLMPFFGMDPENYGRNKDINLAAIINTDIPVHASVNYGKFEDIKAEASACHASQGGSSREISLYGKFRRWLSGTKDVYMQAYPNPNGKIKKDLFEDLSS